MSSDASQALSHFFVSFVNWHMIVIELEQPRIAGAEELKEGSTLQSILGITDSLVVRAKKKTIRCTVQHAYWRLWLIRDKTPGTKKLQHELSLSLETETAQNPLQN